MADYLCTALLITTLLITALLVTNHQSLQNEIQS